MAQVGMIVLEAAITYGMNYLLTSSMNMPRNSSVNGLEDLAVQISSYGKNLPYLAGNVRLAGNIIWAKDLKEIIATEGQNNNFMGKGGGRPSVGTNTASYYATLAIAICQGEISQIARVWADSTILTSADLSETSGKYEIYNGTETQNPSPIIEGYEGIGNVPAYRGVAYVVIEDFPVGNFGNRIPNFTFEVSRPIKNETTFEDKIKAVTLIPGSGEYVYSRTPTEKIWYQEEEFIKQTVNVPVNVHNHQLKPNVDLAIDQMEKALPNLEYVSVVVNWFATSKYPSKLEIVPKVEFNIYDPLGNPQLNVSYTIPEDWLVDGVIRNNAQRILQLGDYQNGIWGHREGILNYGGTPTDKSILEICKYLHSKGYQVMLYPMVLIDTTTEDDEYDDDNLSEGDEPEDNKPWRGRITPTSSAEVTRFFSGAGGYNHFILHYATLAIGGENLKDYIEAFVIGSELVGLTTYSDTTGSYPAVNALKTLAGLVKTAVGGSVKVTYAADWTEYHSVNGWFHLDPLWSDSNIDFIGIDAYFPITPDLPQNKINKQNIREYWQKGEGWDYYWNEDRTVQTAYGNKKYAWKNFEYWWKNVHVNPNNVQTAWTSKMKPIRFTEIGFPSIDGAANQPNVFFDPFSVESFFPRMSEGNIDYEAQREALDTSLDFLAELNSQSGNSNLVPIAYVWTWDARPFPYFPDLLDVWGDGFLYPYGHWIQGKVGVATLEAIVADLLNLCGLQPQDYDLTALKKNIVEGFILKNEEACRSALESLKIAYQFILIEVNGIIKAVKYGNSATDTIDFNDTIAVNNSNRNIPFEITRQDNTTLPYKMQVSALSRARDYNNIAQISVRQSAVSKQLNTIELPIVLSDTKIKQIADTNLYRLWAEREVYTFSLLPKYGYLTPSDVIIFDNKRLRIVSVSQSQHLATEISAVIDDQEIFNLALVPTVGGGISKPIYPVSKTNLYFLDLPALPTDKAFDTHIRYAMNPVSIGWTGATLHQSIDDDNFSIIKSNANQSTIGRVLNVIPQGTVYGFDVHSEILVVLETGELQSVTEKAILNGANSALIGDEIIQFQNAELIAENYYRLTHLLRGRLGTEHTTNTHNVGDLFILLDQTFIKQAMPFERLGIESYYKAVTFGENIADVESVPYIYNGNSLRCYSPVHIKGERNTINDLSISWIRRARVGGDWKNNTDIPLVEETEKYEIEILNGASIIRTIITTSPNYLYTSGLQITDFGIVQSSVSVRIYQIGLTGHGIACIATI